MAIVREVDRAAWIAAISALISAFIAVPSALYSWFQIRQINEQSAISAKNLEQSKMLSEKTAELVVAARQQATELKNFSEEQKINNGPQISVLHTVVTSILPSRPVYWTMTLSNHGAVNPEYVTIVSHMQVLNVVNGDTFRSSANAAEPPQCGDSTAFNMYYNDGKLYYHGLMIDKPTYQDIKAKRKIVVDYGRLCYKDGAGNMRSIKYCGRNDGEACSLEKNIGYHLKFTPGPLRRTIFN